MIYVSSACSKKETICEVIEELVAHGFKNIELTGGTKSYDNLEYDLLRLQDKYGLNYLLHHYFPPPEEPFVLNLASLDEDIFQRSFENLQKAIQLSKKIGATKFSLHAGFFIDVNVCEIGKTFGKKNLINRGLALKKYCDRFTKLKQVAGGIELYLENNVYSYSNFKVFKEQIPFMLLCFNDYKELKNIINFKLLVDIGHLNVTINTLHLNRDDEFDNMIEASDYIHISNNDGLHDQHNGLSRDCSLLNSLKKYDLWKKTITIEVDNNIGFAMQSYNHLLSLNDQTG
jgi:sugar phosphate isomerase/epimerase